MLYFAYGSNMNPFRMLARGIKFITLSSVVLYDAKLTFNKIASLSENEGYANIELCEGKRVEGILYKIKDSDIDKLDAFEGYPTHYEKWEVFIVDRKGRDRKAITYIANPNMVAPGLKPSRIYLAHLLKGREYMSPEYYQKLKAIETSK